MPRLPRLIAAKVALIPLPRQARRSSPRPGRSTLMTSAPRSAIRVAQYGPAMTRERSSTRMPSSIMAPSATIEESLRHRVDLGDAGACDRIDPGLDLSHRLEGLLAQRFGVGAHFLLEGGAGHYAMHEAPDLRLGRRVPPALHDDLLRARRADEAHEAGRRRHAERHAEVDLGNPELRLGGGPAEVARQRQAPAAADRMAVDHRDRRLLEAFEQRVGALEEPAELALALAERLAALLRRHRRLEPGVRARREHGRRAGDDDDARGSIVAQLDEGRAQVGQHRVAEGIAAVGTVQGDGRDRAVAG